MSVASANAVVSILEQAKDELRSLARTTETEIHSVAAAFEGLAHHTDTILNLTAELVAAVESEGIR